MKYEYIKEKRDPQIQWYMTELRKRWRIKFSVVRKGKRHHLQNNGLKSFANTQSVKVQLLTELDNNTFTFSNSTTVEAYWLAYRDSKIQSGQWRKTTIVTKQYMFDKHILPHLGQLKMTELTRPELQAWFACNDTRSLSKSTVEDIIRIRCTII